MKRGFFIETPIGKLKVYAKHNVDSPEDYPGVYIDLVREDGGLDMLACVEYDSCREQLQTCVYQPGTDESCELIVHDVEPENKNN